MFIATAPVTGYSSLGLLVSSCRVGTYIKVRPGHFVFVRSLAPFSHVEAYIVRPVVGGRAVFAGRGGGPGRGRPGRRRPERGVASRRVRKGRNQRVQFE